jgi:predicted RecA/RadA family phage recombinase
MKNFKNPGNVIGVVESALVHPSHSDGLVNSGDPCVVGQLPGVAETDAAATTDVIPVLAKGVVSVSVTGTDSGGNSAVAFGDKLYIDGSTAAITKNNTKVFFGIALGAVTSGATGTIDVRLAG